VLLAMLRWKYRRFVCLLSHAVMVGLGWFDVFVLVDSYQLAKNKRRGGDVPGLESVGNEAASRQPTMSYQQGRKKEG